jgi:hypothetical protein
VKVNRVDAGGGYAQSTLHVCMYELTLIKPIFKTKKMKTQSSSKNQMLT